MASNGIPVWMKVMEDFEKTMDLGPLMVAVQTLRQKASFLMAIVSYTGKWHIEDGNLKYLLSRIHTVVFDVDLNLRMLVSDYNETNEESVYRNSGSLCIPMYLDNFLSSMLERLELVEPQIQQVYMILSKYSRSISCMTDEAVMGHLQFLLQNMEDLLRCKAGLIAPVKNEVEAVQKSLRFLRNFLAFAANGCTELEELTDLLIHAEVVADNIACLLYLCCVNDKMNDQMISWMKPELLSQIQNISPAQQEARMIYVNTLKASNSASCRAKADEFVLGFIDSLKENLLDLSENKLGFNFPVKDQMLILHDELRFLECLVLLDSPCQELTDHDQKFHELSEHHAALINEIACVIYSFYDDENEDKASERNSLVSGLLAKFQIAKEHARKIYDKLVPKSLRSNFPRTNAQGFISSLLRNLKQLLSTKADSVAPLKHHVEAVLEELQSLREDLSKTIKRPSEQEVEDQWTRFKDAAYRTEHVIDSFLAKDGALWFHKLRLLNIIEEIRTIRTELKHLRGKVTIESTMFQNISSFPSQISLETSPKDELVIFEHEFGKIKEQLTHGFEMLQIISIVGMPGIGKSTLANSLFQNFSATYHFHVRATCCVSQAHDNKRLLLEILQQVTSQTLPYGDEDLHLKLRQSLKGRTYLIFLDDIWDFELWRNIRDSFPNDRNGSRIMVTSRFDTIASQVGTEIVAYHLLPLLDDKSWEMLQFKLFGKESCPQELVEIGQKIAASCRGLPLAIDLIAGVLRERGRRRDCWQQLAQSNLLTEFVDDTQARCRKVLELSYHQLPTYLRPCFLYFGGFPEDTRILARWLEWLWIAEGFVQLAENDERTLEDVAQSYMDELISRSLIMVSERGSSNGVRKRCNVHDLLHRFARVKAKEERFLLPIDGLSNFSKLSSYGYPWIEQYRLCISADYREQFSFSNPSGPLVRSLVFSRYLDPPTDDILSDCPINFSNFRLLRVFDVPDVHIKHISPSILQLIHLRFLAIVSCEYAIFSAILQHLQNLETLIIRSDIFGTKDLSLTDMENMARLRFLRHLKLPCLIFPRISQEIFRKSVQFDNLQYLWGPVLCYGEDHHEKFMRSMPNLRRLKCFIESSGNLNSSTILDFLENLETLSILALFHIRSLPSFPPRLKKLTLKSLHLPWTNISALGKLEHLEVLKFQSLKSSTDTWEMVEFDKQFPKLKFLQLFCLSIKEWNASADDLPFLERLQVIGCECLEELPSCLADIPTLQEIKLKRCRNSAAISAEKIMKEQEENGNEHLVVDIRNIMEEDAFGLQKDYEEGLSILKYAHEDSNVDIKELPYDYIVLVGAQSQIKRSYEQMLRDLELTEADLV